MVYLWLIYGLSMVYLWLIIGINIYLLGGLEHEWIILPFSWEWNDIPTDELHHFSEG